MRYLVIPKDDDLPAALAEANSSMAPAARAQRQQMLKEARQSQLSREPRLSTRSGGLRSIARVNVVATPELHTPSTGVTIFEGTKADAAAINDALPNHDVIADETIELIAPGDRRALGDAAGGAVMAVADLDLWHLDAIGLLKARPRFGGTGFGATVAVMDTGVAEHDELKGKILDNIVFDVDAWTAVSVPPADTDTVTPAHGTHVAGIIAGTNVGVAPGARIVSYTMIPNTVGTLSQFVIAMEHVQTRPEIQIINMSAGRRIADLSQPARMRFLARIAQSADVLLVVATGNEGPNTSRVPGNYPEVLSVAACDRAGAVWARSGGGTVIWDQQQRVVPDLFAPGVEVCSLAGTGGYQFLSGTSMATPVVSGIAALMLEKWPDVTLAQLRVELMSTLADLNPPLAGKGSILLSPKLVASPPSPPAATPTA